MDYTWSGIGNLSVTKMGAQYMQKTRSRRSVKYISSSFWIQPQTTKPSTTTSTNNHSSLPELNHGLDRRYEPTPSPRTNPTMDENHFRADIVVKGNRQHVSDQDLPESLERKKSVRWLTAWYLGIIWNKSRQRNCWKTYAKTLEQRAKLSHTAPTDSSGTESDVGAQWPNDSSVSWSYLHLVFVNHENAFDRQQNKALEHSERLQCECAIKYSSAPSGTTLFLNLFKSSLAWLTVTQGLALDLKTRLV